MTGSVGRGRGRTGPVPVSAVATAGTGTVPTRPLPLPTLPVKGSKGEPLAGFQGAAPLGGVRGGAPGLAWFAPLARANHRLHRAAPRAMSYPAGSTAA